MFCNVPASGYVIFVNVLFINKIFFKYIIVLEMS